MPFKDFGMEVLTSSDVNTYLMQQVVIRCTSSTRPGSPTEGWHIYETDTQKFMVYKSGVWVVESPKIFSYAIKTSDENYTSSTLHDDSELFVPMKANSTYWMETYFIYKANVAGFNFIFQWTVPTGAAMRYASNHNVATGTQSGNENKRFFINTDPINCATDAVKKVVPARGIVTTGSTSGNLQLRWKGDGTNQTTLGKRSVIVLELLK